MRAEQCFPRGACPRGKRFELDSRGCGRTNSARLFRGRKEEAYGAGGNPADVGELPAGGRPGPGRRLSRAISEYLVRGGVFANAQTGNIVLLGVRLMEGDWAGAGHYLVPILAFAAGVLTAELVHARCGRWERLHWRQLTVAAEMILLVAVALLPGWADSGANVLVSYVCAVQVQSFRKVAGSAFATTMCTGNLRSGTEALYRG